MEWRWRLVQPVDDSGISRKLPVLEYLGTGAQAHVFGGDCWVVKVRRKSVLGFLGRMISKRKWAMRVRDELGDVILPFIEVDDVEFYGPEVSTGWQSGEEIGQSEMLYRVQRALVMPRVAGCDFLDQRVYAADPAELVRLLRDLLELLRRMRARGFYMIDFVMKNFVYWKGALRVADPGLVVPEESMWEPSIKIGAWGFAKGLSRDYLKHIREALEESSGRVWSELSDLEDNFADEIDKLRERDLSGRERDDGVGQQFPSEVERRARAALGIL